MIIIIIILIYYYYYIAETFRFAFSFDISWVLAAIIIYSLAIFQKNKFLLLQISYFLSHIKGYFIKND